MFTWIRWFIADYACLFKGIVSVPIHTTTGLEDIIHILDNSSCEAVICSAEMVRLFLQAKSKCPSLKYIIHIGDIDKKEEGLVPFDQVEKIGLKKKFTLAKTKPSDIVTIIYTSGSTGTRLLFVDNI